MNRYVTRRAGTSSRSDFSARECVTHRFPTARFAARLIVALLALLAVAALLSPARSSAQGISGAGGGPLIVSFPLEGSFDPASADWVSDALEQAEERDADIVVILLDTPGGLDTSMREIIKDIIDATVPVVVYVSPDGARAASAGLYITEAADVAAMAPQTNIGSATPVSIGPGEQSEVMGRKVTNDAAAYVRALAEAHGRNADLAEEMVRKATNVPASEAKRRGLVDILATSQPDLVRQLNGFDVKGPKHRVLHTEGARVENLGRPWKYDALAILLNPTITFLLLLAGLAGIGIEVFHPGGIVPGALGAMALILAMFGLASLPINVAGVLLIVLAIALFVAEAFVVSGGLLGVAGIGALIAGGLLLFNTDTSEFGISVPVVIAAAIVIGGFFLFLMAKALAARSRKVSTGWEELIGAKAEVRMPLAPQGQVFVHGALWKAVSKGRATVPRGAMVVVEKVDGLTLTVRPAEEPADGQTDQGTEQEGDQKQ